MRHYFGTDGIRGIVNQEPMTADFFLRLGRAAGYVLTRHLAHRPHILIGKDTRVSGYMLESALCAGLTAQGMNVLLVGPVPTPAVAYLTRSLRANAGVVLSASHNPADDNGVKFFGSDGFKLPDQLEVEIERHFNQLPGLPAASSVGKAFRIDDARGRYVEFLKSTLPRGLRLDGLKVVVDCANGAAYDVAPRVFTELGCAVIPLSHQPDGYNINVRCGSLYPDAMCREVVNSGSDIGFALDGDADRLIACDHLGRIVDGDRVIAILAEYMIKRGTLRGDGVVTTLMSNMGLERYLGEQGLIMHRAQVGDRYVLEMMQETGCNLGGEQSGHVILLDANTTGDGLLTAMNLLVAMRESDCPLNNLGTGMEIFPQKLWNVMLPEPMDLLSSTRAKQAIKEAEDRLAGDGRLNVRMSGTEPKLRIMVEAKDEQVMLATGQALADLFDEMIASA